MANLGFPSLANVRSARAGNAHNPSIRTKIRFTADESISSGGESQSSGVRVLTECVERREELSGSKSNTPRSKLQRSSKPQAPVTREPGCNAVWLCDPSWRFAFGVWSLMFLWCLDLGFWNFLQVFDVLAKDVNQTLAIGEASVNLDMS